MIEPHETAHHDDVELTEDDPSSTAHHQCCAVTPDFFAEFGWAYAAEVHFEAVGHGLGQQEQKHAELKPRPEKKQ